MSPPRIAVLTCLWKRHKVSGRVLARFATAKTALSKSIHLELVAVGSEPAARKMAKAHGWSYVSHSNRPLGAKWNSGLAKVRTMGVDAVLIVGSDDMISNPLLLHYASLLKKGVLYAGLKDAYFMCGSTLRCAYFPGYMSGRRRGEPVGAGRMIHASVLDKISWRLWSPHVNRSLDASMTKILSRAKVRAHIFPMGAVRNGILVDIKTGQNLGDFETIARSCTSVGINRVLGPIGNREVRALMVSLGRTPRGRLKHPRKSQALAASTPRRRVGLKQRGARR